MRHLARLLLLSLLLAGCASQPRQAAPPGGSDLPWQLLGKLSISQGGETRVASVDWLHLAGSNDISLSAPLGFGRVHILTEGDRVHIDTGRETLVLEDSDTIEVDGISYRLPWQALSWWVRGVTGASGRRLDSPHQQGPWQVELRRVEDAGPVLILFSHPRVQIRLKVREWRFGSDTRAPAGI